MGPPTVKEEAYKEPFPSHDALCQYILHELPSRNDQHVSQKRTMEWCAELGIDNHARLKRIFDSRADASVIRQVGEEIHAAGGMQAMQAMFYVYDHFMGKRGFDLELTKEQWHDLMYTEAKVLVRKWDGVGEWCA